VIVAEYVFTLCVKALVLRGVKGDYEIFLDSKSE
jgi:hypothetical protein